MSRDQPALRLRRPGAGRFSPRAPARSDASGATVSRAFVGRVAAGVAIALALTGLAAVVVLALDVLLLVFAAILLAILLRALASRLARHSPLGIAPALVVVALLALGLLVLAGWLLSRGVGAEIAQLAEALPRAAGEVRQRAAEVAWLQPLLDRLPGAGTTGTPRGDVLGRITGFLSTTFGAAANVLIAVVVGAYLAASGPTYRDGFARLFPPPRRPRVSQVLDELGTTLGWWLAAKFASMAVIGVLTWAGLASLGVPLATPLALIAALLTFVPNLGPLLSLVPAVLLALVESPQLALYVQLLYAGIQFVETYLVTPLMEKRMVSLPPALTITAQVLFGVLAGFMGLLLAAPLTTAGLVLVRRLWLEGVLGERVAPMGPG